MRLKVFIWTTLSVLVAVAGPAMAQDPAPQDTRPGGVGQPSEPPNTPAPSNDTPPPSDTPSSPETMPAPVPEAPNDAPPGAPVAEPPGLVPGVAATGEQGADAGKTAIGEKLAPLVATVAVGYGYASIKYPGLVSSNFDGPFLEIAGGTELSRQFRLLLAFTSLESPIHRTSTGDWAEGEYKTKVATSGLHSTNDPIEPITLPGGGTVVQTTLHIHSLGPRVDFLPLGSQGPYLGLTTALAITTGLDTRVGADLGARVGGEWRPFQELSVGIEAGAHGQLYSDGNAAVPYATARLNLLLDPAALTSKGKGAPPQTGPMMPRTLPAPTQR